MLVLEPLKCFQQTTLQGLAILLSWPLHRSTDHFRRFHGNIYLIGIRDHITPVNEYNEITYKPTENKIPITYQPFAFVWTVTVFVAACLRKYSQYLFPLE